MEIRVYKNLAMTIAAKRNCILNKNVEWGKKHQNTIEENQ